jgi:hypothetical protein
MGRIIDDHLTPREHFSEASRGHAIPPEPPDGSDCPAQTDQQIVKHKKTPPTQIISVGVISSEMFQAVFSPQGERANPFARILFAQGGRHGKPFVSLCFLIAKPGNASDQREIRHGISAFFILRSPSLQFLHSAFCILPFDLTAS